MKNKARVFSSVDIDYCEQPCRLPACNINNDNVPVVVDTSLEIGFDRLSCTDVTGQKTPVHLHRLVHDTVSEAGQGEPLTVESSCSTGLEPGLITWPRPLGMSVIMDENNGYSVYTYVTNT